MNMQDETGVQKHGRTLLALVAEQQTHVPDFIGPQSSCVFHFHRHVTCFHVEPETSGFMMSSSTIEKYLNLHYMLDFTSLQEFLKYPPTVMQKNQN